MKRALLVIFFLCLILLSPSYIHEQPAAAYAECDVCGYCQGQEAPANWNACAQCRYPGRGIVPGTLATDKKTLAIDTTLQRAIQPAGGKYYTQLGCLDTGLTSFRGDSGAVGATINFILSRLLFPIAGTLAFGTIVYGAFLLLTAQGEQEKILRGKKLITSSIVGVIFTFSSIFIINFIAGDVLKIPGFAKGTKVTFVGYGTETIENGVKTYPELTVFYDGKDVGKITDIRGGAADPHVSSIYLPVTLDLTNPNEIVKVKLTFTNDLCLRRELFNPATSSYSCCKYTEDPVTRARTYVNQPPNPPKTQCALAESLYDGDRNIWNTQLLFDDRVCLRRKMNSQEQYDNKTPMPNYSDGGSYGCLELQP